jgi:hypothetical protein
MGMVVGESSEYQQRSNKQAVTKAGPFPGKLAHFVAIHLHDSALTGSRILGRLCDTANSKRTIRRSLYTQTNI